MYIYEFTFVKINELYIAKIYTKACVRFDRPATYRRCRNVQS